MALEVVSNEYTPELRQRNFVVAKGINEQVAAAMLHASQTDLEIQRYTGDYLRFTDPDLSAPGTPDAVLEWAHEPGKERIFYVLGNHATAGVIWFGKKPAEYSRATTTFAIRIYGDYRGKGLAGNFLEAAHLDLLQTRNIDETWLGVSDENVAARALYSRHDYEDVGKIGSQIIMERRA